MQDTTMTQQEKINALNTMLKKDSGRFVTVKGIGHKLVGAVADADLPGYWFGYRCGSLFHIPVSRHCICLLSAGEKGATNVHGNLTKSDFLQIFGKDIVSELDKAFRKSIFNMLLYYVIAFSVVGGILYYVSEM